MKAILLHIKGDDVKVVSTGVASVLIKQVNEIKQASDFPKGVDQAEVWSRGNGMVKMLSKAKLEAQAKADAAYAKSQKSS